MVTQPTAASSLTLALEMPTPANTPSSHPDLPPTPDPYGPGLIRLTAHRGTQKWVKKHAGKRHYFAPLNQPGLAITEYIRRWPAIINPAQPTAEQLTLAASLVAFLDDRARRLAAGELSRSRFDHYCHTLKAITAHLPGGRTIAQVSPPEWAGAIAAAFGHYTPVTRNIAIQEIRTALRWADRNLGATINTGDALRPVPARIRRKHTRLKGPQLVSAGQIRKLMKTIDAMESDGRADSDLTRAAILLAINAGMRQSDIAQLTPAAYRRAESTKDGVRGWLIEPRPKTEAPRRCPLWPETADAIDAVLERRREQASHPELLFCSPTGSPLIVGRSDLLAKRLAVLRRRAWKDGSRWRACNFDRFRKTFITVARGATVTPPDLAGTARRMIAGHTTDDIHELYTQDLPDEPFIQIVAHVHRWLFGK